MTTVERPPAGPSRVDDTATVLRSEERLTVSLPVRVSGVLRVRKIVRTEIVTQTVEVRREHLLVEELGVDDLVTGPDPNLDPDQESAAGTTELADRDFEIVLHEERVVLSTEVVPVERVRVRTRVVTDKVEVSDSVRRERIETANGADLVTEDSAGDVA